MAATRVKIKNAGNGNPPYWYSNLIGEEFVVRYVEDGGLLFGNNFPPDVYELIPGMNPGEHNSYSSIISPQDIIVIN